MVKFQISIHIEELDYLIQSIKTFFRVCRHERIVPCVGQGPDFLRASETWDVKQGNDVSTFPVTQVCIM